MSQFKIAARDNLDGQQDGQQITATQFGNKRGLDVNFVSPIQINVPVGITPRGAYDNLTAYVLGDVVSYNGRSYLAYTNTTGNLPTDTAYWQLLLDIAYTHNYVAKNLMSWDRTFVYTGDRLTSIILTDGVDTITQTFNYTGDKLTSIVLSGDTPVGIDLTKTFTYTGDTLTGEAYS